MEWLYEWMASPEAWVALATLAALEIVLGIDNIIFISILTSRLPAEQQPKARRIGLFAAMAMRIVLLFFLSWIMRLQEPLFELLGQQISGRDLILLIGGLFLIAKSTLEIHHKLEGDDDAGGAGGKVASFGQVLVQVMLLDVVFSLDSVITAVGMVDELAVMILAVVLSVVCMVLFVDAVCRFVEEHPTFKMLALSFLLLIGVALVGEGLDLHIPKGYIYSAMGFSVFVELLNMRVRGKRKPVRLRGPQLGSDPGA